jgi:ubiquinone/menaquinone biosynthesis C-methylase UbiE
MTPGGSGTDRAETTEYVDFWNEILVPKFVRFKHVLVDGLTHHSAAVLPHLKVRPGDAALDVGCGFGDTAIQLARLVGPGGRVVGIDCCNAFLAFGRRDDRGIVMDSSSWVISAINPG